MPGVGVLDIFGHPPPEDVAAALVEVILHYPLFDPLVDTADRLAEALDVALAVGAGRRTTWPASCGPAAILRVRSTS